MEQTIQCQICKREFKQLTASHLKHHQLSITEYKNMFPEAQIASPESKQRRQLGANEGNKTRVGVPRTQSTKEKIRNSRKLNPAPAWNKGVPMTEEQKEHLSETMKKQYDSGERIHHNLGKQTSTETKAKIRASSLGRVVSIESLQKRQITLEQKRLDGWIHPSTLRKGKPLNLSVESRQKIKNTAIKSNHTRIQAKQTRVYDYLKQYNIRLESVSDSGYLLTVQCLTCNNMFTRTASVFTPYRYEQYSGQYCPTCYPRVNGIYTKEFFLNNPQYKQKKATLYVVTGYNETESFVKVGITTRTTALRLMSESVYQFDILAEYELELFNAFQMEQFILDHFKEFQYVPQNKFGGFTECLTIDTLPSILELL